MPTTRQLLADLQAAGIIDPNEWLQELYGIPRPTAPGALPATLVKAAAPSQLAPATQAVQAGMTGPTGLDRAIGEARDFLGDGGAATAGPAPSGGPVAASRGGRLSTAQKIALGILGTLSPIPGFNPFSPITALDSIITALSPFPRITPARPTEETTVGLGPTPSDPEGFGDPGSVGPAPGTTSPTVGESFGDPGAAAAGVGVSSATPGEAAGPGGAPGPAGAAGPADGPGPGPSGEGSPGSPGPGDTGEGATGVGGGGEGGGGGSPGGGGAGAAGDGNGDFRYGGFLRTGGKKQLEKGEFVMNREATRQFRSLLAALNTLVPRRGRSVGKSREWLSALDQLSSIRGG